MAFGDRISEVYKGQIWSRRNQKRAIARIDWLAAQAAGRTLDLGCSQGIASLLVARRGQPVVGVDLEHDRLVYAEADRRAESAEVRQRVGFLCADGGALPFADASFDAVLLGEVIEHLRDPAALLAEVDRVLAPGGRLAVTTPFGRTPHRDPGHGHPRDRTFFLRSLVSSPLTDRFAPLSYDLAHGYSLVVLEKGAADPEALLRLVFESQPLVEKWALELQREQESLLRSTRRLEDRVAGLQERLTAASRRVVAVEAALVDAEAGAAESKRLMRKARRARDYEKELSRFLKKQVKNEAYRADVAEWRLGSVRASRWWRMGDPLRKARRKPWLLPLAPFAWLRVLTTSVPRPARPLRGAGSPRTGPSLVLPVTLAAGPVARPELMVAVILDPFSSLAFRYEWRQVEVGPTDWRGVLEDGPALLFVESAWRGNGGLWNYAMTAEDAPRPALVELVEGFRERGVPTVFWNKEDPPNYEKFIATARLFDVVFTVDADCIARYRADLGHDNVHLLPFAAQPRVHNPVLDGEGRSRGVAFAGSYFAEKHPERREQMEMVLAPALERGLEIFSRMESEDPRYRFPDDYRPHIVGTLPYESMVAAYKRYKVFLNVNSVTGSPTMCARRIFELAAAGTPVLSGPAVAIENYFDEGEIRVTRSADETREQLATLLQSRELRDRGALRAQRRVFREHTFSHRVDTVLRTVGLPVTTPDRSVSLVVPTNRAGQLDNMLENVTRQTHQPIQLVCVLHGLGDLADTVRDKARAAGIEDVVVLAADAGLTLGACMRLGVDRADGAYVGKMDDDNHYGAYYVEDLLHAFAYTEAGVVGKWAHYVYLESQNATVLRFSDHEHRYVDKVQGGTILATREVARDLPYDDLPRGVDTAFLDACARAGVLVYSADRYNFVSVRRADVSGHTWQIRDDQMLARSSQIEFYGTPYEHVTV